MKTNPQNHNTIKCTQLVTAVALTSIFSLSGNFTGLRAVAESKPEIVNSLKQPVLVASSLPGKIKNAVLNDISRRANIPVRRLEIVNATQKTWRNGCLELPRKGELCTQALVPGWRIIANATEQNQTWIYHTNSNGNSFRLAANQNQNPVTDSLPSSVKNAVLKAASKQLKTSAAKLTIIQSQQRQWRNGCLEITDENTGCTQAIVPGWRVVVAVPEQTLVYHTNSNGKLVVLNRAESTITDNNSSTTLPNAIREKIIQYVAQTTGGNSKQLRISQVQDITVDGCLSLPAPGEACTKPALPAYRVTVLGRKLRVVLHILKDGSQIRINESASRIPLPQTVRDAVIRDVKKRTNAKNIKIINSDRRTWSNGCLDIPGSEVCTFALVPGWRVQVRADQQTLVYHTDTSGQRVRFNPNPTSSNQINLSTIVRDRLLNKAVEITGINKNSLTISQVETARWSPTPECFGARVQCRPPASLQGLKVTISDNQNNRNNRNHKYQWVLFSNQEATQFKLSPEALPVPVREAVLRQAEQISNLPTGAGEYYVEFLSYRPISNSSNNPTNNSSVASKWQIQVKANGLTSQELLFYTDNQGKSIQLADQNPNQFKLPPILADKILKQAATASKQPQTDLQIIDSEPTTWSSGCEDNPITCDPQIISGWKVTVASQTATSINRWVFLSDKLGKLIQLSQRYTETRDTQLPNDLKTALITQAAKKAGVSVNQVQIEDIVFRTYPNGCGGRESSGMMCTTVVVSNWFVKIRTPQQILTYEVSEGGRIALKSETTATATQPLPIPNNELPPPLESGVIFRQVTSGGLTGQTYETVLLDDGRLMQFRIGDMNDTSRRVFRVTPLQVQQFVKVLNQQEGEFQNLSYPTTQGAADYITYTLTSANGTIQYSDISQASLPTNVIKVIQAWKQIQQNIK